MKTVCILTAGMGSRMGKYSDIVNKSLLPLKNKAIISHIIEFFGVNSNFVIAVGFKSQQVKDYLKIAHPKTKFTFVKIADFNSINSGPGKSLYACKKFLNRSFFFISCDTIINDSFKNSFINRNFVGTLKVPKKYHKNYCNFSIKNNLVTNVYNKTDIAGKNKPIVSFVGYSYIKDYSNFWKSYKTHSSLNKNFEIFHGYTEIINKKKLFALNTKWIDVGDYELYEKIKLQNIKYDFSKTDEFIYFVNKRVIKFNISVKKIQDD